MDNATTYVATDVENSNNSNNSNSYSYIWIIVFVVIFIIIIIVIIIAATSMNGSNISVNGNRRTRIQVSNATSGTDTLESGGNINYFATPAPAVGTTSSLQLTIPASPLNIAGTTIQVRNLSTTSNSFISLVPGTGVTIEPRTDSGIELGVGPFPSQVAVLSAIGLNRFVRMQ